MNKKQKGKIGSLFSGKTKDLLIMGALGLVLFYTSWRIFQEDTGQEVAASLNLSESESKVMRILQEIDGVGDASVVVCETKEEGVKGVVVVCEGARNLQVIMDVREAVAAALDTQQNAVKIYLKKE